MKKNNQHNDTGFKVPKNYFENFETELFQKLEIDVQTGFTVPQDYFKKVETKIVKQTSKPTRVKQLSIKKIILYTSSIAAAIVFSFYFFTKSATTVNSFEDVAYDTLFEYADSEFIDAYDIASFQEFETDNLDDFTEIPVDDTEVLDYLINEDNIEINNTNL